MKINAYNPNYNVDLSGATGLIASSATYAHTALGSNTPLVESGSGSPGTGPQASAWNHVHPALAGSTSFGSNSNSVGTANSAGASSSNSRADHIHKGVSSIAKSGSTALVGDVTLTGGTNVTLTQSGNDISIASTGGGSTITTKDEGSTLSSSVTTLDFVGAGVTASGGGATTTITIPGGGGSSTRAFGLDPATFNATYGDDFTGASLDAKWSRQNQIAGQETYQVGGLASILKVAHGSVNAAEYIYQTAPNGTNETWEASVSWWQETATNQQFAILMVDGTGKGAATILYDNTNGLYLVNLVAHVQNSVVAQNTNYKPTTTYYQSGGRVWLRLRKASTTYFASYSFDGQVYSSEVSGSPTAFTPTRVGIGRILGTNANSIANWHWFDKTA